MKRFLQHILIVVILALGNISFTGCSGGEADYSIDQVEGVNKITFLSRSYVIVEKIADPIVELEVQSNEPVNLSVISGSELFTVDPVNDCVVYAENVDEGNVTNQIYTIIVQAVDTYGKSVSQVINIEFVESLAAVLPQIDSGYNTNPYIVHDDTEPFTQVTAYDPRQSGLIYSLEGKNSDRFEITNDGYLSLKNVISVGSYEVIVVVTDASNSALYTESDIIKVTAVETAEDLRPIILSESFTYVENDASSRQIEVASDGQTEVLYYLDLTDDGEFFTISATGALNFDALPNFENPINGSNTYHVTVNTTYNNTAALSDSKSIEVTVVDIPDAPSNIVFDATKSNSVSVDDSSWSFSTKESIRKIIAVKSPTNGTLTFQIFDNKKWASGQAPCGIFPIYPRIPHIRFYLFSL